MPLCLLPLSLLKVYFDRRVLTVHAVDRGMQMRSTQADPVVGYICTPLDPTRSFLSLYTAGVWVLRHIKLDRSSCPCRCLLIRCMCLVSAKDFSPW